MESAGSRAADRLNESTFDFPLPLAGDDWSFTEWDDLGGSIFGFGEDEDGELYLLQGSDVLRFESASDCEPPDTIFIDGFESGNTSSWSSQVP